MPGMPLQPTPKVEVHGDSDDELSEGDFDYEESDLSSGELDYAEPGQPKRKTGEYKSAMVLATPRIVMSPVSQLYEDIEAGDIDLEPDYQRDVVWAKTKQSAIIESLLRHYYIPPILFSACKAGVGGQKYTCIDGKQRLSSIRNFMNNEIPVKDASGKNFYYQAKRGNKGLPPEVAKRFKRESIPTVIYENLRDEQEREMFQRVQMGMVLSPAEKVYARKGPWNDFVKELAHKFMDHNRPGENLCHVTETKRAREWMGLAQITLMILHSGEPDIPWSAARVGTYIEKHTEGPTNQLKKEAEEAIDRFVTLANDERWNGPVLPREGRGARLLSPAEFAHAGFLCWRYPHASYYDLARWVGILRTEVHENFYQHVHFDKKVTKWLRDRIDSFTEEGAVPRGGTTGGRKRKVTAHEASESQPRSRPRPSREERDAMRSGNERNGDAGSGVGAAANQDRSRQQASTSGATSTTNNAHAQGSTSRQSGIANTTNGHAAQSNGVQPPQQNNSATQSFYGEQRSQASPRDQTASPLFFDAESPNVSFAPTESLFPHARRLPPRNPFQ